MLAAKNRLRNGVSFQKIKKEGIIIQSESFGIAYYERGDNLPPQFGFVISNKVAKNASQRNRIKRALRESVRQNISRMKNGYDVVFLAKSNIEKESTENIMTEAKKIIFNSEFYSKNNA